jgi:PAS domain S-box-containing protein
MKSLPTDTTSSPLFQSDELFQLLLELGDYAIMLLDPEGKILSWNIGAEYMYEFTAADMLQQPISILYPKAEANAQSTNGNFQKVVQRSRIEYNCWQQKKDGTLFFANVMKKPLHAPDGSLRGFVRVVKDITAQKAQDDEAEIFKRKLEQQVRQRTSDLEVANRELEAFSYSISHDLRAPLRSVIGFSRILHEDYASVLDAEGQRLLNNIITSAAQMSQLIDDLLKFSRMSRLEVVNTSVDVRRIVDDVILQHQQMNESVNCRFAISELPTCMADESMLKLVWFNLLDNAIKYSSKNDSPEIEIGGSRKEGTSEYYIKDNGVGFDMKYADKLFGVFQRLHSQREFAGTGLGLALVQRIVHKHNGQVWANATLNEGATFYFTIPDKKSHEYTS